MLLPPFPPPPTKASGTSKLFDRHNCHFLASAISWWIVSGGGGGERGRAKGRQDVHLFSEKICNRKRLSATDIEQILDQELHLGLFINDALRRMKCP